MKVLTACALTLALLPGCASKGNYLLNRSGDLVDILRLHGMAGKGVAVKLEVTRLLHAGGVWEQDVGAAGLANRELATWRETIRSWGVLVGYHDERKIDGIPYYSGSYGWNFDNPGSGTLAFDQHNPLDLLTVRGTLMLGLGLDVEVRVGEVVDFVVGLFQFDPAGDDIDTTAMSIES